MIVILKPKAGATKGRKRLQTFRHVGQVERDVNASGDEVGVVLVGSSGGWRTRVSWSECECVKLYAERADIPECE